jgi:hypothetical protein
LQVAERLQLGPLTPSDLDGLAPFATDLLSYFGGSPRLLADGWRWKAAGNDGIPPSLRSKVLSTTRKVGGLAVIVAQIAALLDEPFDPLAVIRCAELPFREVVDELDRLRDFGILDVEGDDYRFRHPVIRDVLAESVSPARRQLVKARHRSSAAAPGARWSAAAGASAGDDDHTSTAHLSSGSATGRTSPTGQ